MKQIASQQFVSECGKCVILVENDMPVGQYHDFLLKCKGHAVDIMVKAQKDDEALAAAQAAQNSQCETDCKSEG